MRKTLIDINPWGIGEDMYAEPNKEDAGYFATLYNQGDREVEFGSDTDTSLELNYLGDIIRLQIRKVLGGNQWNVLQNLKAMNANDAEAHFGTPGGKPIRKILYVPGIPGKIDLVNPEDVGDLVWNKDLKDTDVFVSSSPQVLGGEAYWQGLRDALARDASTGIIWNPARKQISGGLEQETLEALKGRVKILQVNEAEARKMVGNYQHGDCDIDRLPELVNSKWTIVTRGARGIRAYVDGQIYDEGISTHDDIVKAILGEKYCDGADVGCGDMVLATLIMHQDLPIEMALQRAAFMGKMQFHHAGSNLSSISGFNLQDSVAQL